MLDSAIKADPRALLNGLLSNTCWGTSEAGDDGTPPTWTLVSTEPSLVSPREGLKTYLQYVAHDLTPLDEKADLATVKNAKATRRRLIQSFTFENEPGASLANHISTLTAALQNPAEMMEATDVQLLESLGLVRYRTS